MNKLIQASLALAFLFCAGLQAQTNIAISGTTLQTAIKGAGVNMGQNLPYSSGQFMKNLINENPGFNPTLYRSLIYCGTGTNSSLCVDTQGQSFASGFWPYGTPVTVMTGTAAGCTTGLGTVSGSDFPFTSACSGIASGDYIFITKTITSSNAGSSWLPAYGWTTTTGSGSPTFTISTDVPPSANGDTYTQSLDVTTPTSGDIGYVTAQADYFYNTVTSSNQSAIKLSGSYTLTYWAKSKSGSSPNVVVSFGRTNNSPCVSACFLNFTTDTITGTWTQYSHTFSANETTVNNNALQLNMAFTGPQEILIDNVAVTEATTSGNSTPFRNAVVTTLQNLKPGSLRMWNHQSLTDTIPNMLAGQFARSPNNFLTYVSGVGYNDFVVYGIPDMLQLCQAVGSDCWISIPVTSTNAEVSELVDYLSDATGTTTGGALRIAQGFSTPWTSVTAIPKIHIELGNEEWNFGTEGGDLGLNLPGYGIIAQGLFATMKAKSDYVSSKMSLSVGSQFASPATAQSIQNNVSQNDEIVVGPYMYNSPYDYSSTNNIWQPLLSEPYVYWAGSIPTAPVCAEQTGSYPNLCPSQAYLNTNPGCTGSGCTYANYLGGGMNLNVTAESLTTNPKTIAIYEQQLGTGQSPVPSGQTNYTQADMYLVAPSLGAGLSYAEEILLNLQNGIKTQNTYQLAQPYFGTAVSGVSSPLWGIVNSMGGFSDTQRPQYLAQQMINNALYPTMITTSQTANPTATPTINVGSPNSTPTSATTVNTVAMNNVPTLQSFAFTDGSGHYSLIIINSSVSNAAAVTYSGTVPSGSITQTVLNSTNLSDNNESSSVVAPVTTTVFTPPSSLPAHSMYVLSWQAGTACQNNSGDVALVQAAMTAGGAQVITGTCNLGTSTINVNNAVQVSGGANFVASTSIGTQTFVISPTANPTTSWTGMTFTAAGLQWNPSAYTADLTISFTNNTVTGFTATSGNPSQALFFNGILKNSTFTGNSFSNLWPGGFSSGCTYIGSVPNGYGTAGPTNCTNNVGSITGVTGIWWYGGLDNTVINNNTFTQIGANAIKGFSYGTGNSTSGYQASGVSISYNTFSEWNRIAIEYQNGNVSGVNGYANVLLNPKFNGNFFYQPSYWHLNTYCISLPVVNTGASLSNNSCIGNYGGNPAVNGNTGAGYSIENPPGGNPTNQVANGGMTEQGNVTASDSNYGWSGIQYYISTNSPIEAFTSTQYFQNNLACGNTQNYQISDSGTVGANAIAQYNYQNISCPAGTGTSLYSSSVTPSYLSQSGSGTITFNFGVVSNLSIQGVAYTVDGASAGTQEIADVNSSNFPTTAQWRYHITLNTSSYSSGSHTLRMTATDVNGTTNYATTTFSGGGSSPTNISPGTYGVTDGTTSCSGSGFSCTWDGGLVNQTNNLSLYQQSASANTDQEWTVATGSIANTFTICNVGLAGTATNPCLVDSGSGSATLNGTASGNNNLWYIQTTGGGSAYYVKNYATSNYVQDATSPSNVAATTMGGSTYLWNFASVVPPTPMTYYVSNSGSDSNNGTSASTPWQTIAKVNATTLVAGSNVYFNRGNTWREKLVASASGTSGNPITYGAYGSGATPIITGGSLASWTNVSGNVWSTTTSTTGQTCHASSTCLQLPNFGGSAGIPVASQSAVTTANDYYFDGVSVLYIYSIGTPASTVEVPARNYAFDLGGNNYLNVSNLQFQAGLYYGINCQSASTGCSSLNLSGNTATLNVSNGIELLTTTSGQRMGSDTIANNIATYNGSSGIKIGGYWQAFTDSGNTASYNCIVSSSSAYYDNQFCGGIYAFGAGSTADGTYSGTFNASEGSGSTFIGDTATYNGISGGMNTNIGHGIWLDTVTNVSVTQETAYGNLNNQIYSEKDISSFFRHNLGYGAYASNSATGCLTVAAGLTYNSKNNVYLENTCDDGYSALLTNFESSTGVMIGNTFQNNIFYQHALSGIAYLSYLSINTLTGSGGGTGNTFVTNGFGAPRSNFIYYNSAFYSTYAAFESAFGASTNSMQLDPALVAPATGNYALTSGSPARGAGTTYSGYPPACSGASRPDLGYLPYGPCAVLCCLHP